MDDNGTRGGSPQGVKFDLISMVLRVDLMQWIERRRSPQFRGRNGDGTAIKGPLTFRELADEINAKMAQRNRSERITFESVRAWYRKKHPTG